MQFITSTPPLARRVETPQVKAEINSPSCTGRLLEGCQILRAVDREWPAPEVFRIEIPLYIQTDLANVASGKHEKPMRKSLFLLGVVGLVGVLLSGCAGPERKLGRGVTNLSELARWGEMSRSIEESALFGAPGEGTATGMIRGANRSLARAGVGLYEIVTFPFPSYDPVFTDYLTPGPGYPESYKPGKFDDSILATDNRTGFSGGEFAPIVPGSRFKIFDN